MFNNSKNLVNPAVYNEFFMEREDDIINSIIKSLLNTGFQYKSFDDYKVTVVNPLTQEQITVNCLDWVKNLLATPDFVAQFLVAFESQQDKTSTCPNNDEVFPNTTYYSFLILGAATALVVALYLLNRLYNNRTYNGLTFPSVDNTSSVDSESIASASTLLHVDAVDIEDEKVIEDEKIIEDEKNIEETHDSKKSVKLLASTSSQEFSDGLIVTLAPQHVIEHVDPLNENELISTLSPIDEIKDTLSQKDVLPEFHEELVDESPDVFDEYTAQLSIKQEYDVHEFVGHGFSYETHSTYGYETYDYSLGYEFKNNYDDGQEPLRPVDDALSRGLVAILDFSHWNKLMSNLNQRGYADVSDHLRELRTEALFALNRYKRTGLEKQLKDELTAIFNDGARNKIFNTHRDTGVYKLLGDIKEWIMNLFNLLPKLSTRGHGLFDNSKDRLTNTAKAVVKMVDQVDSLFNQQLDEQSPSSLDYYP
jgi:hypothetical protein